MKSVNKKNYSTYLIFNDFLKNFLETNRIAFYMIFKKHIGIKKQNNVLDIGSVDSKEKHNNVFLYQYPYKHKITCLSDQKLKSLIKIFPKTRLIRGDAKKIKFINNSFDIVHSNATIEHVGNTKNQIKFLSECYRVAKNRVFIVTPNRFFPIELHTYIPLLHFLPKTFYRLILKIFGNTFFSKVENLNLLSEKDLRNLCKLVKINNYKIVRHKLFGFTSNLILIIKKN